LAVGLTVVTQWELMGDREILVVGEDPLARNGLALLLSSEPGFAVSAQTSLAQAAGSLGNGPVAAVVDLGAATRPELGSLARALPVVALVADGEAASDALAAGARAVLPRDVPKARLIASLRAAIEGLIVADASFASSLVRARRAPEAPAEPLTHRELEVLQLLTDGLSNKAIADRLGISDHTAKFHVNSILGKLGAQGRTDAVVRGARLGLVVL
jgi:two-component system, NarL family, nitrate/nitrite response regulator NarL